MTTNDAFERNLSFPVSIFVPARSGSHILQPRRYDTSIGSRQLWMSTITLERHTCHGNGAMHYTRSLFCTCFSAFLFLMTH